MHSAVSPDASQFEQEALTHLQSLLGVARRLTRSRAEAEDLVQDTYVKAFRARDQYQAGTHLRAWLLKILRNTFINRYHRNNLERSVTAAAVPDPVVDQWIGVSSMRSMRDVESNVLRPELERRISDALDEIPEEFRIVVVLVDVEELSYREVAETLGCPIGTVMSRLHRGRRLLRSRLTELAQDAGFIQPEPESPPLVELDAFRERATKKTTEAK